MVEENNSSIQILSTIALNLLARQGLKGYFLVPTGEIELQNNKESQIIIGKNVPLGFQ